MNEPIDLKRSTISLKVSEHVIAYTSFSIQPEKGQPSKEGLLKISEFCKPEGSGYLTFTFIVDTEDNKAARQYLALLFNNVNEKLFRLYPDQEINGIINVPLDSVVDNQDWFFEEFDIYFHTLKGRERSLVEQMLIPALEALLPCSFEPLEWRTGSQANEKQTR